MLGPPNTYLPPAVVKGEASRFAAVQLSGTETVYNETYHFLQDLDRTDDPYQRLD